MREFRKTRIQREVSELLADVDTWNGGAGSPPDLILRQIGVAFFSLVIGVVLGQSVALMALKYEPSEDLQFQPVMYSQEQSITAQAKVLDNTYPELPEIKLIYVPQLNSADHQSRQSI